MKKDEVVQKLRRLPEWKRQSILWGVTGVLGVALLAWWVLDVKNSIQQNDNSSLSDQLQLDSLQENLQEIPITNGGG
jgi:hypothetical protein